MGRFCGLVGFVFPPEETAPGVYSEEHVEERRYFGDTININRRLDSGVSINDDISTNTKFSIIADDFANKTPPTNIRYIKWMNASWKVIDVAVERPRLLLSVGGVYNGVTK